MSLANWRAASPSKWNGCCAGSSGAANIRLWQIATANPRSISAQAIDPPAPLYHDARRVGSFLAQMDPSGHLTAVKHTENATSASGMKFSAHAGAGVSLARGGGAFEDQRTAGEQQSAERTYDPLWTNALALLDMLDERGMIRDGLESARIGQFVKVSGYVRH